MTKEKKFITARHVLQGWRWLASCDDLLTVTINNADMKKNLIVTYEAISKSGHSFTFTNENIRKNDSKDYTSCDGVVKVIDYDNNGATDWAYYPKENLNSDITINRNISKEILRTETLHVLGYTSGMLLQNSVNNLDPIYDKINTTNQIEVKGMILANAGTISGGCSGAPIFAKRNGRYEVIGILSGSANGTIARIVPIYNIE